MQRCFFKFVSYLRWNVVLTRRQRPRFNLRFVERGRLARPERLCEDRRRLSGAVMPVWQSHTLLSSEVLPMTRQKHIKREASHSKVELREMLAEAVRNTNPKPEPCRTL